MEPCRWGVFTLWLCLALELYSETSVAVSSGRGSPREKEVCSWMQGPSRRREGLAWGWTWRKPTWLMLHGGRYLKSLGGRRQRGKAEGQAPKEKSNLSPLRAPQKTTYLQAVKKCSSASAGRTSSGSSWPPHHCPLKRGKPLPTCYYCFIFFLWCAVFFSSPTRTNPIQWRCANCLIKGLSCIRVIWIKKVAICEASDKRPRGRQGQQCFGHKGISSPLFWNQHHSWGGFRSALSICDTPAFWQAWQPKNCSSNTVRRRWAQRLAIPSLEVQFRFPVWCDC